MAQQSYEIGLIRDGYSAVMDYEEIRQTLEDERLKRGWPRAQAAKHVSRAMAARAARVRAKEAQAGIPKEERASLRDSITGQGLNNWERRRSRPSLEDLASWAEALGMEAIVEVARPSGETDGLKVMTAYSRLSADEQAAVLLFTRLLEHTDGSTYLVLRDYPGMMARSLDLPAGWARRSTG